MTLNYYTPIASDGTVAEMKRLIAYVMNRKFMFRLMLLDEKT